MSVSTNHQCLNPSPPQLVPRRHTTANHGDIPHQVGLLRSLLSDKGMRLGMLRQRQKSARVPRQCCLPFAIHTLPVLMHEPWLSGLPKGKAGFCCLRLLNRGLRPLSLGRANQATHQVGLLLSLDAFFHSSPSSCPRVPSVSCSIGSHRSSCFTNMSMSKAVTESHLEQSLTVFFVARHVVLYPTTCSYASHPIYTVSDLSVT